MKNILFPTDFSKTANNALGFAVEIAKVTRGKLCLFNAFSTPSFYDVTVDIIKTEEKLRKEALKKMYSLEKSIHSSYPGLEIEIGVDIGFTAHAIRDAVDYFDADLIVMGTKGASGIKKILFGSNTVDVINKVDCPVLVIPGDIPAAPFKKIVLAVDYQEEEMSALNYVKRLAFYFNAEVAVIHVENDSDTDLREVTLARELAAATVLNPLVKETFVTLKGEFAKEITRYIDEHNIDLLVMVQHDELTLAKIFNTSHTQQMAFKTKIPVLICKE